MFETKFKKSNIDQCKFLEDNVIDTYYSEKTTGEVDLKYIDNVIEESF